MKGGEKRQGWGVKGFLPTSPSPLGTETNGTPVLHAAMGWDESGMGLQDPPQQGGGVQFHCRGRREGWAHPMRWLRLGSWFPVCYTRRCHNPLTVCLKALSLYS